MKVHTNFLSRIHKFDTKFDETNQKLHSFLIWNSGLCGSAILHSPLFWPNINKKREFHQLVSLVKRLETLSNLNQNFVTFENFLQKKQRDVLSSHSMSHILQNIFRNHPFLMSRKFETRDCQWCEVKRISSIFCNIGNSGTRFGAFLYYRKHFLFFFIETDLRQGCNAQ